MTGNGQGSQVISGNLVGVEIDGSASTRNLIEGNFIGTDKAGTADRGNANQGVLIDGASGNTIGGTTAAARNVISANQWGIQLDGPNATGNLIEGNFIGTDVTGTLPLGNEVVGIVIEGAAINTVGGTTAAASNVISANRWGIQVNGPTATGNLIEGNLIGTDVTGTIPLGNAVNGVLFTNNASNNTVGGTAAGQGNTIAFNVAAGVSVQSGTGDSILSNSIFSNGQRGIFLSATGNNGQRAPVISAVIAGSTVSTIEGSLNSVPNTSFLIQFFSSVTPDPSGFGQGQTFFAWTTVRTNASGSATFSFNPPGSIPAGQWITATATNQTTGDTSAFSNAVTAQPVSLSFSMANYTVYATARFVEIEVLRAGNMSAAVSVHYATSNGTAIAGRDYTAVMGTLSFPPNVSEESFSVPILDDPFVSTPTSFFYVTLSQPTGGATLGPISSATVTIFQTPIPPPTVTGVQLITNRQHIVTGIVVSFSELLNPTTAVNLLNYNYSVTTAGRDHLFGTRDDLLIPITTAVYNPSNRTVKLTLGRGIHPPTAFRLAINQLTDVPGAGVGVSNLAGELLSTYVVILKGTAGGIVPSTRQPAVTRKAPRAVAAVDAVLETGKVGSTWVARGAGAAVFAPSTVIFDSRRDDPTPSRVSSFNSARDTRE